MSYSPDSEHVCQRPWQAKQATLTIPPEQIFGAHTQHLMSGC